jgi:hypothetical protein
MEQFPSTEKHYTREDLEKAEQELGIATEHFNSFNNGEEMGNEEENEYLTKFTAAKDDYTEKAAKVKEIEAGLNA